MFQISSISSISSRTVRLRSFETLRCERSLHSSQTHYGRAGHTKNRSRQFEPIPKSDCPRSTEQLSACLHSAFSARGSRLRHQEDNKRVNIVSNELCKDILNRMKPSLLKHAGCDIIDINPGAGVWSSAIHDLLKPRNHIMMEPDHEMYQPLLQPLLDKKDSTYKLVHKSGVVWSHLNDILTPEFLPQQTPYQEDDPQLDEPNNTLLFMANLAWHPKKPFRGFQSISQLVIYQLTSAIRAHSLFHQYGLVRMILWLSDDDGQGLLPKAISLQRKAHIEGELSCSKIIEIASSTQLKHRVNRGESINFQSSRRVLKRMNEAGITTPDGRAGLLQLKAAQKSTALNGVNIEFIPPTLLAQIEEREAKVEEEKHILRLRGFGTTKPGQRLRQLRNYRRRRTEEGSDIKEETISEINALEAMEASSDLSNVTEDQLAPGERTLEEIEKDLKIRTKYHRNRLSSIKKRQDNFDVIFEKYDAIVAKQKLLRETEGPKVIELQLDIDDDTAAFHELKDNLSDLANDAFQVQLDNRTAFNSQPSVLRWDNREFEPLKVLPEEFYPQHELCLVDFHPQPLWPALRKDFPASYDQFEYILGVLYSSPSQRLHEGLSSLAPGAYEWFAEECPSLKDVSQGGNPNLELISVRCLTMGMLKEILEAWMRWPFKPDRFELLRKMGSEAYDPDIEAPSEQ